MVTSGSNAFVDWPSDAPGFKPGIASGSVPDGHFEDVTAIDTRIFLLDQMVARGNVVAESRKDELEKLLDSLRWLKLQVPGETSTGSQTDQQVSMGGAPVNGLGVIEGNHIVHSNVAVKIEV